jgi:hypothetical protein
MGSEGQVFKLFIKYLSVRVVGCQIIVNLCYHVIVERNRVQEQKFWGIFPGQRSPKKSFWDRGSQGCRILSVSKEKAFAGRPVWTGR